MSFHRLETLVSSREKPMPVYFCRRAAGSATTVASTAPPWSAPVLTIGRGCHACVPPVE
ncbi:hypothetical protein ACFWPQ_23470 [Streptomyces sp. NPDC058464]|uniref:hypothetical protein n=1 Tax=Streptomyces sp. NPDC058464 TaxID=3346511 RepID=UPI0036506882